MRIDESKLFIGIAIQLFANGKQSVRGLAQALSDTIENIYTMLIRMENMQFVVEDNDPFSDPSITFELTQDPKRRADLAIMLTKDVKYLAMCADHTLQVASHQQIQGEPSEYSRPCSA